MEQVGIELATLSVRKKFAYAAAGSALAVGMTGAGASTAIAGDGGEVSPAGIDRVDDNPGGGSSTSASPCQTNFDEYLRGATGAPQAGVYIHVYYHVTFTNCGTKSGNFRVDVSNGVDKGCWKVSGQDRVRKKIKITYSDSFPEPKPRKVKVGC